MGSHRQHQRVIKQRVLTAVAATKAPGAVRSTARHLVSGANRPC